MPRPVMRPPSGPQRLALAPGHESALLFAMLDGGALHMGAQLQPSMIERMGEAGSRLAQMVSGREARQEDRGWAPQVPEWAEYGERTDHGYTLVENGAVIDISGALMARGWQGWFTGCYWPGYRDYVAAVEAAQADERVDFVFLRFDTPGGNTNGMCEAARAIREMNEAHGGNPIVGHAAELCCSAGMALAAQCDAFYASDGATVGSIGTRLMFFDMVGAMERWGEQAHVFRSGRLKDMGAWWREPSEEEAGLFQLDVDHSAGRFYAELAAGRDMDLARIRKSRGWEAQTFTAGDPPPPERLDPMRADVGLIDGVLTEEAAFQAAQSLGAPEYGAVPDPQSTGAEESRAAQKTDSQAAASTQEEPTMSKLSAQAAALLAKKKKGTLTTAEAADLKKLQALLAAMEEDTDAEGEEDTEAEGEEETDAEGEEDTETDAEGEEEDTEAEGDDGDKSAQAQRVLDLEAAQSNPKLAGRLALRVAEGRMTFNEAVADLKAAKSGGKPGLVDRLADAGRRGATPGDGKGSKKESALVASAREMAGR